MHGALRLHRSFTLVELSLRLKELSGFLISGFSTFNRSFRPLYSFQGPFPSALSGFCRFALASQLVHNSTSKQACQPHFYFYFFLEHGLETPYLSIEQSRTFMFVLRRFVPVSPEGLDGISRL
jgi:hypothetical protein